MANGFSINPGIGAIDQLLSRGGMDSMLATLWLIIGAVTFGALLTMRALSVLYGITGFRIERADPRLEDPVAA
jgi:hypothetical protein